MKEYLKRLAIAEAEAPPPLLPAPVQDVPRVWAADRKPPPGKLYVRIDGGDANTPWQRRQYVAIDAGHGAGARTKQARLQAARERVSAARGVQ